MMLTGARSLIGSYPTFWANGATEIGADAADAEGIAIRRRACDGLRPDDAAGPRPAVDDDGLAQCLLDVTGGQPGGQVGVAAGA